MGSTKFTHFFSSPLCRKNKADVEMSEGVGNPVYDTFNEGQPLEDVSYFIKFIIQLRIHFVGKFHVHVRETK